MDIIHIEARRRINLEEDKINDILNRLPNKIIIASTIQYLEFAGDLKSFLEKKGKIIKTVKGRHSVYDMQMLGCDILELEDSQIEEIEDGDVDAFLYIGDGVFHPKAFLIKFDKPVFRFNPLTEKLEEIKSEEIEKLLKRQKGALLKFLTSTDIGVLITTKTGQHHLDKAQELKKKYPDKNFYFLVDNTIDFASLENFPFVECFVNTACPRIGYDDSIKITKPIINADDVLKLEK